jgi:uncharacterized SAM-binding protein YcdF (DUF218 family)
MNDLDKNAKVIWDYMLLHHKLKKVDALFILGSSDIRVAERGAELYKHGYADHIIIAGSKGKVTEGTFTKSEARTFANTLISNGVPEDKIFLEEESNNTGHNISYTYMMLKERGINFDSFILITKPYMERRSYATFMKMWPGKEVELIVTSPQLTYENYPDEKISKEMAVNLMVGDLQRIKEYPAMGWQIEQDIPIEVEKAYRNLVELGFSKYLLR